MRRFVKQPKKRGALRLRLGRAYFIARRYAYWAFGGLCFARRRGGGLPHELCPMSISPIKRRYFGN
ncbi:MAG: hypothetical protein FWB71_04045 [Defluviitaleaceae bacterium]|nr:hypothetical protein [Defluviitaleaceae bacterium]